jgi:hypothetical protein
MTGIATPSPGGPPAQQLLSARQSARIGPIGRQAVKQQVSTLILEGVHGLYLGGHR